MSQDKKNYKTSLCRHYVQKGYCSLYNNCHFAHGQQQLRKRVDPIPTNLPPPIKPLSIYKTQLCKYYENGFCRNSYMCPFAHGLKDLRGIVLEPKQPDYGNADEFLFSILRSLEQVFSKDQEKKVLIEKGIEMVKDNKLPEADHIITQLVKSNSLSDKQKQQCQTILQNAHALHKINFIPI